MWETMPFKTEPALILPGQRMKDGTRHPPSQFESFWPRNGVLAPSGQVSFSGPLSVEYLDDGVVGDPQLVELGEYLANLLVVDDHAIAVGVLPALAKVLFGDVGAEVHCRRVVPEEEGLVRLDLLLHPFNGAGRDFLVDGLHALLRQGPGVRDRLPALTVSDAVEHSPGTELLLEGRILGIVGQFRFLFRVQVIEVAEELVEPVHRRQVFVTIAEVVLAELAGGITERLQHFGDGRVFLLKADLGTRHPHLRQARADRILAGDEAGAPGRAALLGVVIGEGHALFGNTVDVGRAIAHHAAAEVADVPDADVVSPEDQNVWFFCCHGSSYAPSRVSGSPVDIPR